MSRCRRSCSCGVSEVFASKYARMSSKICCTIIHLFLFCLSLCSASLSGAVRVLRCFEGLTDKPFPTLFPENYTCAERKNFPGNALQSGGTGVAADLCDRKNRPGTGRWNSREKQAVHAAIKGEDGKKGGGLLAAGAKKEGRPVRSYLCMAAIRLSEKIKKAGRISPSRLGNDYAATSAGCASVCPSVSACGSSGRAGSCAAFSCASRTAFFSSMRL